jgi:hypothetical protein
MRDPGRIIPDYYLLSTAVHFVGLPPRRKCLPEKELRTLARAARLRIKK